MSITTGRLTFSQVKKRLVEQVGVHEDPAGSNRQKFGVWYGWNGVPWCAIFLSWGFRDNLGQIGGKTASVQVLRSRFHEAKRYGSTPRVGSLAIFTNDSHAELVLEVHDGHLVTVGGNTSRSDGSNPWSGQVAVKKRYRNQIRGYCYPRYAAAVSAPTQIKLVEDGYWGSKSTTALQQFLNRTRKAGLTVDGKFGPATTNAVLKWVGRTADSSLSSTDIKAVERKVGSPESGTWARSNTYDRTSKDIQRYLNSHRS